MLNVHLLDDISISGVLLTYKWKSNFVCMIFVVTRKPWVKNTAILCRHRVPFILSIVGNKICFLSSFPSEFQLTEIHYLTYSSTLVVESKQSILTNKIFM